MSQLQALHGNEAKVVVLSYPNPSAGYETPSCMSMAWDNETFRYASPRMSTALDIKCLRVSFATISTINIVRELLGPLKNLNYTHSVLS